MLQVNDTLSAILYTNQGYSLTLCQSPRFYILQTGEIHLCYHIMQPSHTNQLFREDFSSFLQISSQHPCLVSHALPFSLALQFSALRSLENQPQHSVILFHIPTVWPCVLYAI